MGMEIKAKVSILQLQLSLASSFTFLSKSRWLLVIDLDSGSLSVVDVTVKSCLKRGTEIRNYPKLIIHRNRPNKDT